MSALLSPAEQRVFDLVIEGLTNKEIARTIFRDVQTVESHLYRIFKKMGARNRTHAVVMYLRGAA